MKEKNAVICASVNGELSFSYDSLAQNGPKKNLTGLDVGFSGSSGNVANAIKKLGGDPFVIGLVGIDQTLEDKFLHEAISSSGIPFKGLPVLDITNIAILPVDHSGHNPHVFGRRGVVQEHMIEGAVVEIRKLEVSPNAFVVFTSLRPSEEFVLREMIPKVSFGRRILNFNYTFGKHPRLRQVLSSADMLVINRHEQEESGLAIKEFQAHGPQIVIVTDDKKGGEFMIRGKAGRFEAKKYSEEAKTDTGAGDWFMGALVSWMIRENLSVPSMTFDALQSAILFATQVAGKKVTMRGGSNGPSLEEL